MLVGENFYWAVLKGEAISPAAVVDFGLRGSDPLNPVWLGKHFAALKHLILSKKVTPGELQEVAGNGKAITHLVNSRLKPPFPLVFKTLWDNLPPKE